MLIFLSYIFKRPAALLLAVLFFSVGCSEQNKIHSVSGSTMGTTYTVKWVATESEDVDRLKRLFDRELKAVNMSMSTYISDSELSLFNTQAVNQWVEVSSELAELISVSQTISNETDGQFDITVGPLVNLWGFGPDGRVSKAPSDDEIALLRKRVGFAHINVELEPPRLKRNVDAYVDLSAIAKGYGVDVLANILEKQGVDNYLVEIGGELRLKGVKPDSAAWLIAIEAPDTSGRSIQTIIQPGDAGMATSGDYRNYFEENGVRYSHTINPETARPITHKLASVTVLAENCALADAYATALLVMGEVEGMKFAQSKGLDAYFIVKTEQGFTSQYTDGFEKYFVNSGD